MADDERVTPGLPGYHAAPPGQERTIPLPPLSELKSGGFTDSWPSAIIPLVFGIIGFAVFNVFGVVAIFVGIAAFRSTGPLGKILSALGILFGLAGLVWSIVDLIRTHNPVSLIF